MAVARRRLRGEWLCEKETRHSLDLPMNNEYLELADDLRCTMYELNWKTQAIDLPAQLLGRTHRIVSSAWFSRGVRLRALSFGLRTSIHKIRLQALDKHACSGSV